MKCLITNRGEIARRILKSAKNKGWTVGVLSTEEDSDSLVCQEADFILKVSSYLNSKEIIEISKKNNIEIIHPGYGFLSENAEFAELIQKNNILFAGPTSENMKLMGSKESAKKIALECGVPTLEALYSHELKKIPQNEWKNHLEKKGIFAPYLIKASGGGGGRGMRVVENAEDLPTQLERACSEALNAFRDGTVFIERYLQKTRHIETQIFGDGKGGGVFLGERECSLQRRHQKVIEEAPSPIMTEKLREEMARVSLKLVAHTKYRSAGTLEFLMDKEGRFYFLEMNTRLQVEHPVTEMVYEIDLVDAMLTLATDQWPQQFSNPNEFKIPVPKRHAIETRILAEDPANNFLPTPGDIYYYKEPHADVLTRIDTSIQENSRINPNYDSMISKLICSGKTRQEALSHLKNSLLRYQIYGITTNIPFLKSMTSHHDFSSANFYTSWIDENLKELNFKTELSKELLDFIQSENFANQFHYFLNCSAQQNKSSKLFSDITKKNDSCFFWFEKKHSSFFQCYFSKPSTNEKKRMDFKNLPENFEFFYHRGKTPQTFEITFHQMKFVLNYPFAKIFDKDLESSANEEIRSPMAGKVLECLIQKGDSIVKNQVLFILESMKMQLEVKASKAGVVKEVFVEKNQILQGSVPMAFIQ